MIEYGSKDKKIYERESSIQYKFIVVKVGIKISQPFSHLYQQVWYYEVKNHSPETEPVDSILCENLDPVIGWVGHDNGVVRSHSDPPGPSEQPGLRPAGPKGKQ